jgi:hypothetical protein
MNNKRKRKKKILSPLNGILINYCLLLKQNKTKTKSPAAYSIEYSYSKGHAKNIRKIFSVFYYRTIYTVLFLFKKNFYVQRVKSGVYFKCGFS